MTALVTRPLDGEILGPDDSVTVVVAPHPLRHAHKIMCVPAGWSVAEILRLVEIECTDSTRVRGSWHVSIEGEPIPADWHGRVRIKAGRTVVLRARASGGGNLLRSLLMVALMVITAFIAPYLEPILGKVGAGLVIGAITIGGQMLINALFPAKLKDTSSSSTYSIAGNQNLASKYEPVPVILGRLRVYPRYGASAYTEIIGNDQYLRLLYVWGYGPLDITDLKIGETPLQNYKGVEVEHGYGYPADGQPKLYPGQVIQQDYSIDLKAIDEWVMRTTSESITEFAIDLGAPGGMSRTDNKKGKVRPTSVVIGIQYSVAYANEWIALPNVTLTGASSTPIRQTVTQKVALGQYDIRVRRWTPDFEDIKVNDKTNWTALRSFRPGTPILFPFPVAWTALKIRATSQLNGTIDNFSGVVTSRVKAWDGAAWVPDTPSAWPPDLFVQVLQSYANARPVPSARIDWPAMQAWKAYCVREGWKYNNLLDRSGKSVYDTLKGIASAGRGAIIFKDGLWSVVWDDPDAPITQHYTPRNSTGFQGKREYRRLPHGLRVQFKNESRRWQDDEILVFRDGYDKTNATLFEQFPLEGITDHTLAWRFGRYHLAQLQLRPETYTLSVDIESFINTRGDRVRVTYDAPMFGLVAGRVKAVADNQVTLDEEVIMEGGKNYAVRFRTEDGASLYRTVQAAPGPTKILTLAGTGAMPAPGDLAMFGEAGQESVVLRVYEVRAGKDITAEIDFVDDAPAILQADQGEIPPYDSQISDPPDPTRLQPFNLRLAEGWSDVSNNFASTATLSWDVYPGNAAVSFEIMASPPEDANDGLTATVVAPTMNYTWLALRDGTWTFEVRAIFGDGAYSSWSSLVIPVLGATREPPDVTGFAVNVLDASGTFSWDPPTSPVAYAEIRYSPATAGATWASATVLVPRASGVSVTAPFASGTYLIKNVSYGGAYSANASLIIVENGGIATMNVVEDIFDSAPFEGTHSGTYEAEGALRLAYLQDLFALGDWFGVSDFFMGQVGTALSGTYELAQTIDLGEVYTSRVSGEVVAHAISLLADFFGPADFFASEDIFGVGTNGWEAGLQLRTTKDDPAGAPVWTDWAPLVIGDYTCRAYQFRAALSTSVYGLSPAVTLIHANIDMPDRDIVGKDIPVPVTGVRIDFSPPFHELKGVVFIGQGLQTGDYPDWGAKDRTGFNVTIRNAAGAAVARTVDYIAKGYGRIS